jgi:hypothetical protein
MIFGHEVLQFLMKNKNANEKILKSNFEEAKKNIIDKKTYSFEKNHPPIHVDSAWSFV